MAAFDSSKSSNVHGRLRARPSVDHEDSCLPNERIEYSGERGREVDRIHIKDVPDSTRGILDTECERRRRFQEDGYYARRVRSRMDLVLPGERLPGALSLSDKGILQSSYGIIYRRDLRTNCNIWSRKFCERTSSAAH